MNKKLLEQLTDAIEDYNKICGRGNELDHYEIRDSLDNLSNEEILKTISEIQNATAKRKQV